MFNLRGEDVENNDIFEKHAERALTGVAQLVGCCPVKQKATDLIPSQGTCLGCRFGPWLGCV